jgi:hypothetical protein
VTPSQVEAFAEALEADEWPVLLPTPDANGPAAMAELLAGLGAAAAVSRGATGQVVDWVEVLLPDLAQLADAPQGLRQAFSPLLEPGGLDSFLDRADVPAAGRSVGPLEEFGDLVTGAWGPAARAAAVARLGANAAGRDVEAVARILLGLAAILSIPIHGATMAVDADEGHLFLLDVLAASRTVEQRASSLGARVARGRPAWPEVDRAITRHLRASRAESVELHTRLEPRPRSGTDPSLPRKVVPIGCDEHFGALLDLHAWHAKLGTTLEPLVLSKHHFTSTAWRAGIHLPLNSPIDVDQTPRLAAIRAAHAAIPHLISEAVLSLGRDPSALPEHNRQLKRLTAILEAVSVLLGEILITERLMNIEQPEIGLWEQLDPLAGDLEFYLAPLLGNFSVDNAVGHVEAKAREIDTVMTSFQWAQIIKRAIHSANDVIFFIDGAAGAAEAAASLLRPPPGSGGAVVITGTRVLQEAEVARILAGANVMFAARTKRPGPTTVAGRLGQQGERRVGLQPGRPRRGFWTRLNRRKWKLRVPDDNPAEGDFKEVKNVLRLNMTSQLTDYMWYAVTTRRRLNLFIRPAVRGMPGTTLSGPLRSAIEALRAEGLIRIRFIPPRMP